MSGIRINRRYSKSGRLLKWKTMLNDHIELFWGVQDVGVGLPNTIFYTGIVDTIKVDTTKHIVNLCGSSYYKQLRDKQTSYNEIFLLFQY